MFSWPTDSRCDARLTKQFISHDRHIRDLYLGAEGNHRGTRIIMTRPVIHDDRESHGGAELSRFQAIRINITLLFGKMNVTCEYL